MRLLPFRYYRAAKGTGNVGGAIAVILVSHMATSLYIQRHCRGFYRIFISIQHQTLVLMAII